MAAKPRNNSKLKSAGVLFLSLIKVSVGDPGQVLSVQMSLQDPEKATIIKDTCTPTLRAALFTITRTRKQPRCPSADKWIKKMWIYIHTHNGILLSHKKNEFESLLVRWMNLEPVIQSEVSKRKTNIVLLY